MRIGIVAGEASGDLLAAGLMDAIRERVPDVRFEGVAGPRMIEAGCEAWFPAHKLAVIGLFETFGHYPELLAMRDKLARRYMENPPAVFIGVDAPDFNFGLERRLKRAGIPAVHYVSPSVWAWRQYRLPKIAKSVDLLLALLPFEAAFYREHPEHHVPVEFVGHPLADTISPVSSEQDRELRRSLRASLGLPEQGEIIALLPGSRVGELRFLGDSFAQTAAWCARQRPGLSFIAPMASHATRVMFEQSLATHAPGVAVRLLDSRTHDALRICDAALVASGTATLETLLLQRPMVVAYRMSRLTAWIARRMLSIPYYSLPNLLAGKALVQEFTQQDVRPDSLGPALLTFLEQPQRAQALQQDFADIHQLLRQGASAKAAAAVLALVNSRQSGQGRA